MPADPSCLVAFQIRARAVAIVVFGTAGVLWALGGLTRLWVHYGGTEGWMYYTPDRYLDLDRENSFPAWFATVLLLACGAAAALAGGLDGAAAKRRQSASDDAPVRREGRFWWVIALAFVYLSLDEMTSLHESLGTSVARRVTGSEGTGFLFNPWVLIAVPAAGLFAAASLPFLLRLPRGVAVRIVAAGAVFVAGAAGAEILAGPIAEERGMRSLPYALMVLIEEGLELAGASLFLTFVLQHVENRYGTPAVTCSDGGAPPR